MLFRITAIFLLLISLRSYAMGFTIDSSAFTAGSFIPSRYTCEAEDVSPPLSWHNIPSKTKSLALIVDDPDAPRGTWVHWVVFNLPATITALTEAADLPAGAINGKNSWHTNGYRGPCPPQGIHRYFFKLYALDTLLKLDAHADKAAVLSAMQGHVIVKSELMGKYQKES